MKKTILKRILVLTIVFLMIISTPFSITENINNNPYVYATTATFGEMLDSKLFDQLAIPMLISAGLYFAWPDDINTSYEHINRVKESLKDYLNDLGGDYEPPNDPKNRKLEEFLRNSLIGSVVFNGGIQGLKALAWIDDAFWHLVRNWVNDMYDEGENILNDNENEGYINGYYYQIITNEIPYNPNEEGSNGTGEFLISINGSNLQILDAIYSAMHIKPVYIIINDINLNINTGYVSVEFTSKFASKVYGNPEWNYNYLPERNDSKLIMPGNDIYNENPIINNTIIGVEDIVDNPNYDWNNNFTDTKVIPIPIEMDPYGNPKKDENGLYLPSIDVEEWLDVQPTEIPLLDPSGTPISDIPPFPDIENPDDDEKTGILIYIGNILQLIVGQLSKVVEGINTIVANTNQLVFNTPTPIFDPTTGQQIDPETGQPVEPEPEASTGDGIIGDGIDTNIPTDFEWGDFKHLLDIFFIFIYFIVILILILLKFLNVVFMSLPSIPANTELFNQYPEILEGVNFVKNLKVGGMSITVQQSFEMIFLIFFFIFAIKQIRKLYGASVFEQAAESKRNTKDMKMDYYENSKQNEPTNYWKGIEHSHDVKSKRYNDDDYENIHFDGF